MKVFISGASGLVGGNCMKLFRSLGWEVTGSHCTFPTDQTVYFDSLQLSSSENFDLVAFKPDVVIHCGALTNVDYCETHEAESYEKNVMATQSLIPLVKQIAAKLVFISTDYVFDGINGPYQEDAPTHPLNVYGKHKLEAEALIQEELSQFLILRVTNVYGDEIRKKNFVARIERQVEAHEKISLNLPYDQFASPTDANDIARAIEKLLLAEKNGIYHIGGTDYMNRVSLALKVLGHYPEALFALHADSTANLNQIAKRPLNGGFIPSKFLSEFPEFLFSSLDEYLLKGK